MIANDDDDDVNNRCATTLEFRWQAHQRHMFVVSAERQPDRCFTSTWNSGRRFGVTIATMFVDERVATDQISVQFAASQRARRT